MKKRYVILLFSMISLPCIGLQATTKSSKNIDLTQNNLISEQDFNSVALMSAQDLFTNGSSNLNLTNSTGKDLTVFGVYLYGVASITPGLDCTNGVSGPSNSVILTFMSGLVTPINFNAGQSVPIGQNYLYNMIYAWIYYYSSISGTPGCLLPGCTWGGETTKNWCVQLGAISPDANYNYTNTNTNIVPFAWPTTYNLLGYDYNYNLIANLSPNYIWLGPFTCNDKTLTCSTSVPVNQSFP